MNFFSPFFFFSSRLPRRREILWRGDESRKIMKKKKDSRKMSRKNPCRSNIRQDIISKPASKGIKGNHPRNSFPHFRLELPNMIVCKRRLVFFLFICSRQNCPRKSDWLRVNSQARLVLRVLFYLLVFLLGILSRRSQANHHYFLFCRSVRDA